MIEYRTPYSWQTKGVSLDARRLRINHALAFLNQRNIRVLDVGCGDGFMTNELAKHVKNVVGIDVSETG